MRSTAKVWALITTILFGAPTAATANLIVNGGFETGDLTGWTCSAANFCAVNSTFTHSGSYAMDGVDNGGFGSLSQTIATTPGATYLFSFWGSDTPSANELEYSIGGGPAVLAITPFFPSWAETTASFVASGDATTIAFLFATQPGSGALLIDDVSVVETAAATSLPAALPLFATGIGGLGLLGWRRKRKAQAVA